MGRIRKDGGAFGVPWFGLLGRWKGPAVPDGPGSLRLLFGLSFLSCLSFLLHLSDKKHELSSYWVCGTVSLFCLRAPDSLGGNADGSGLTTVSGQGLIPRWPGMVQEHSECPSCVCVYPPQLCVQRGLQCEGELLSRNTGPSAGLASGREEVWVNRVCPGRSPIT